MDKLNTCGTLVAVLMNFCKWFPGDLTVFTNRGGRR